MSFHHAWLIWRNTPAGDGVNSVSVQAYRHSDDSPIGSPPDPAKPPYIGGDRWTYQVAIEGGRQFRGGQVVDFIYDNRIGLRTQTTYWHLQQGSNIYWEDIFLKTHQQSLPLIIDLFDQHYLPVGDGSAACRVVALALKGIQLPDPFRTGTLQPKYMGVA